MLIFQKNLCYFAFYILYFKSLFGICKVKLILLPDTKQDCATSIPKSILCISSNLALKIYSGDVANPCRNCLTRCLFFTLPIAAVIKRTFLSLRS